MSPLRDRGRAVVIGEQTFGKGTVQSLFSLRSGSPIKLTTARFYLPSGISIQKSMNPKDGEQWGVTPSDGYAIEQSQEDVESHSAYRASRDALGRDKNAASGFADSALILATDATVAYPIAAILDDTLSLNVEAWAVANRLEFVEGRFTDAAPIPATPCLSRRSATSAIDLRCPKPFDAEKIPHTAWIK